MNVIPIDVLPGHRIEYPGMNEAVKIDIKISRKTVSLLNDVIGRGLTAKDGDQS